MPSHTHTHSRHTPPRGTHKPMPLRRHAGTHARTHTHTHTHTHSRHIPPRGVPQVYAFTHKHTHTCTHALYTRNILLPLYLPGELHKSMPSHVHTYTHSIHKPAKGHLTSLRFYTHTHVHIPSTHISLCTSEHPRVTRQVYVHAHYTQTSQGSLDKSMASHTYTHTHTHTPSIHITFCYLRTSSRVSWQSTPPHTRIHTHS